MYLPFNKINKIIGNKFLNVSYFLWAKNLYFSSYFDIPSVTKGQSII